MMHRKGAQHCRDMLSWNHELAGRINSPGFRLEPFERLQTWQRNRLAATYADLMAQESYRPACTFFLEELYGGLDFLKRDQDVARVMPVMSRMLPETALTAMAGALELQAISLEFDMSMAVELEARGVTNVDLPTYASAYRSCNDRPGRAHQIRLIRQLCGVLAHFVNKPLVTTLVRLMRGPAHAAGFGELQDFLESGLMSFRNMEDPDFFAKTIFSREWRAMERLFSGDDDPYGL